MLDINNQQRQLQAWLEQCDPESKVCFFGFSLPLPEKLKNDFTTAAKGFFSRWQAHNRPLQSDFFLFCDQFLLVAVNPAVPMSGCAGDSLNRFIRDYFLGRQDVSLMDVNDVVLLAFADMKKEKGQFLLVRRYALSKFFQDKSEDYLKKISVVNVHFTHVKQWQSKGFFVPYWESYLTKSRPS